MPVLSPVEFFPQLAVLAYLVLPKTMIACHA